MTGGHICISVACPMMIGAAAPLTGQDNEVGDIYTKMSREATDLRGKLGQLANEFPEDLWDWRPMEGVRSLREVVALATAEGTALLGRRAGTEGRDRRAPRRPRP